MPQHVEELITSVGPSTDLGRSATPTDPPSGPVWDSPLDQTRLVLLDLEMTGLDPRCDAIVEVAMVQIVSGRIERVLDSLVSTDRPPHPAAFEMHGIDQAALARAPTFAALAPRIVEMLTDAVPIAHGAALDVEFLVRALSDAKQDSTILTHVIDSVTLARRALAAPSYTLSGLSETLGLPPRRWHRAREDVAGLESLLPHLLRELAPVSARDLWEVRVGQREAVRVRQAIATQLAELARTGTTCTLIARTPGRRAFRLHGVVERWAPPHVTLAGRVGRRPAVRVLRADRILRIEHAGASVGEPERT